MKFSLYKFILLPHVYLQVTVIQIMIHVLLQPFTAVFMLFSLYLTSIHLVAEVPIYQILLIHVLCIITKGEMLSMDSRQTLISFFQW